MLVAFLWPEHMMNGLEDSSPPRFSYSYMNEDERSKEAAKG